MKRIRRLDGTEPRTEKEIEQKDNQEDVDQEAEEDALLEDQTNRWLLEEFQRRGESGLDDFEKGKSGFSRGVKNKILKDVDYIDEKLYTPPPYDPNRPSIRELDLTNQEDTYTKNLEKEQQRIEAMKKDPEIKKLLDGPDGDYWKQYLFDRNAK